VRAPVPFFLAVVVERELAGPSVVGVPGGVGDLEEEVRLAVVADDEDDIALKPLARGGELPQVDAAGPVGRDRERCAGLPGALPQPLGPDRRIGLDLARDRPELLHQPAAVALVIAHPVELQAERRGRIGADVDRDRLAGPDARLRGVALDPGAAIPGLGVDLDLGRHPVAGTGPLVLATDSL